MFTTDLLLKNQYKDPFGNTHFVVGERLVASFLPRAILTGEVRFEVNGGDSPDEKVRVESSGPVVVVYPKPIDVKNIVLWLKVLPLTESFWVNGAINGLVFGADLVPFLFQNPHLLIQASEWDLETRVSDQKQLARDLLLAKLGQIPWDEDLVRKIQENRASHFADRFAL